MKLKIRNEYVREFLGELVGTFVLLAFGDGVVAQVRYGELDLIRII